MIPVQLAKPSDINYLIAGFNAVGGMLNAGVDCSNIVLVTCRQSRWRRRIRLKPSPGVSYATTHRLTSDVTRAHDEVVRVMHVLLLLPAAVFLEVLRLDVGHGPVLLCLPRDAL